MRQKLLQEAGKCIDQREVKIALPPIRKEEELTQLVSIIIPKKMKAQIMSGNVIVGRRQSLNNRLGQPGIKKTTTSSLTRHVASIENHVALDRTLPNEGGIKSKGFYRRFSKEK